MKNITTILVLFFLSCIQLYAQNDTIQEQTNIDDIAQELSNPVSMTASLTFQGTYAQWGGSLEGASNQNSSSLVFLPTLPFKAGKYNISVRPSLPFVAAPTLNSEGDWTKKKGFGDMIIMGLMGRMYKGGLLLGLGPTVILPTASAPVLGKDQWQVGPVALAGVLKKWGVIGILWQHWWGVGNIPEGQAKVNTGTAQFFYWFQAGNGWQIGGSPITTANYINGTDTDFVVPINLGFAKTMVVGNTPVKFTLQGQYFVTRPETFGADWGVFFQITPVIKVPW